MSMQENPVLTVVVPTHNRAELLQKTVRQVLTQSFDDFELLVIDQSDDAEAEENQKFFQALSDNRIKYRYISTKGLPNARNEAIAHAKGEIVLFLDDDVILLDDHFVAAHLGAYRDPKVGGVTGRHIERSVTANTKKTACHVSWTGRTVFNLLGTERVPVRGCKGSNMSFRRAVFAEIGGFDRRTEMLEDADFSARALRAGWLLLFEPAAELLHLSAPSGGVRQKGLLGAERRRFRSTSYYVLKHRGLLGFVPFVLVFTCIAVWRAVQTKSISAAPALLRSVMVGIERWRQGPDERLELSGVRPEEDSWVPSRPRCG